MSNLTELGVIDAIVDHLKNNLDKKEGRVGEINCGTGELAKALKKAGITKYQGIDPSKENIDEAKKLKGFKTKFQVMDINEVPEDEVSADPIDEGDSTIVVAMRGVPYAKIPSGQKLIAVTHGQSSWDEVCLLLAPYFKQGAKTVQHGSLFVTYGVRA